MISSKTPFQNVGYASLAGGAVSIVLAILSGNIFFILIAALAFAASFAVFKYGYLIAPAFTKAARIVELHDDFEIPPTQDIVIKKANNVYYATVFLGVKIHESISDKALNRKTVFTEMFERLLANSNNVFSLTSLVYAKDLSEYRSKIGTARIEAEIRLTQFKKSKKPDLSAINREKRLIELYTRQLQSLTQGARPMGLLFFLKTTSAGLTRQDAIDKAFGQARELKASVSNALNAEVFQLTGDYMKRCFEWEKTLPTTPQELEDQLV